jgi:glyoxylase-like metal-dependent hydrolase (beta-lactamase superfamily II)
LFLGVLLSALPATAQATKVEATDLGGGVHMLVGRGGNLALFVGEDGAFLIDDQYAPQTPEIKKAIATVTPESIRFLVNTHWHGDHTGGNENFGKGGAVIVAHENVRKRMSSEQFIAALGMKVPPAPRAALPVITFRDSMTFHWNGDTVDVIHVAPAHTDGDSVVRFKTANVLHTGDIYFNGFYPFMDASSGGSLAGMIAGATQLLKLVDDKTQIIPGHGKLSKKSELAAYVSMLTTVHDRLSPMVAAGKTVDDAVAAKPTAEFDAKWGGGFLKPDAWVRIVYAATKPKSE